MAHIHSVYDTDKHFTIIPATRVLENQTPEKVCVMQYDHDSERITFDLPAVVEGHNILDCNRVEVHYLNIDAQTKAQRKGLYEVDDLQLSPADEAVAICSWLISGNATQLVGPLYFRVTFKCVTEGSIDYSWSTAIYKGLTVSDGINCTEYIAEQYADILADFDERLCAVEAGGGGSGGSGGDSSAYVVDLAKYGITAMESHKPPFTDDEWLIASNNVKGFNRAFEEAYNNGYTKVIVPKGKYPVLYQNTDAGRMNSSHYYSIKLHNNTVYDFGYSCLWVMFDSDNAQPYDYAYSDTNYYKAGNTVIGLSFIKNVDIHNLELEGERELRSFAVSNERNVESTVGLASINEAYNIRCHNCNFRSFMADGFCGKTQYGSTGYAFENIPLTQGEINPSNGSVTASAKKPSSYSELLDITKLQGQYANIWTGIGYNYVIGTKPNILVVFYDADIKAISNVYVMQGHKFYVPSNAKYCRVRFKNVYTWEPLTTQTFRITNLSSGNFEFNHCNFYNNHRGGVSNVPNYTIFNDCEWYHNGKESYGGAPVYGDSTRYAMDIEDIQSAFVVLNHCREYDNGNGGLFLGGIDIYISNSDIEKISVYRGVSYLVTNSTCCFNRTGGGSFDDLSLNAKCSNSTIFVNSGVCIDLSAFNNCDIIIQNGHLVSTYATTNRIYTESLAGDSVVRFNGLLSAYEIAQAKIYGSGKNNSYVSSKTTIRAVECEDVTLDVASECLIRVTGGAFANIAYKNCKINLRNVLALGFGSAASTVKFENCEFSHGATALLLLNKFNPDTGNTGLNATFEGCTFDYKGTTDGYFADLDNSSVSTAKNHYAFTNCKFNNSTGHAVHICDDKDYNTGVIEFVDCSYDGVVPYPSYTA